MKNLRPLPIEGGKNSDIYRPTTPPLEYVTFARVRIVLRCIHLASRNAYDRVFLRSVYIELVIREGEKSGNKSVEKNLCQRNICCMCIFIGKYRFH